MLSLGPPYSGPDNPLLGTKGRVVLTTLSLTPKKRSLVSELFEARGQASLSTLSSMTEDERDPATAFLESKEQAVLSALLGAKG